MAAANPGSDADAEAVRCVRILVVDDEKDDFTLLAETVSQVDHHKYELEWVESWIEAERRLNGQAFDILICDFYLKDSNAIDVMTRMEALGMTVPVVVLTGDSTLQDDLKSMQHGAYDYLEKANLTAEAFDRCMRYALTRHELEEKIKRAAFYDELTDLPNRRFLIERMVQALARAQRKESELSLVLIDLNGFKPINDDRGHEAGDYVLRETGQRILNSVRRTDTAARWGGDEFIVVLEDFKEREETEVKVSGSFGVVYFPEFCLDVDQLIRLADRAMYRAKQIHKTTGAAGSTMIVMSVQEVGDNAE
jgi:PleD family two-component response regulator